MFAVRSQIHPANRAAIDKYLRTTWKRVCTLTSSFATTYQSEALYGRFQGYVEAEEQRLQEGLEMMRYKLDEVETLALITGPGRIEHVSFSIVLVVTVLTFYTSSLCLCSSYSYAAILRSSEFVATT